MVKKSNVKPAPAESRPKVIPGTYHVFHHVRGDAAPTVYITDQQPMMKGAFIRVVPRAGNEVWLSGNLTIRRIKEIME